MEKAGSIGTWYITQTLTYSDLTLGENETQKVEMTGVFVFPQIIVPVFSRYYIEQRALWHCLVFFFSLSLKFLAKYLLELKR